MFEFYGQSLTKPAVDVTTETTVAEENSAAVRVPRRVQILLELRMLRGGNIVHHREIAGPGHAAQRASRQRR
jgi:hypothetical protein